MGTVARTTTILIIFVILAGVAGCAGPNPLIDKPDKNGHVAGFGTGIVHGLIAPITFLGSLFTDDICFY